MVLVGVPTGVLAILAQLTEQIPVLGSTAVQDVLFYASVVFGPALLGYLTVSLAMLPAWRELKDIEVSAWSGVRNTTRGYVATVAPKFGLFVLGMTLSPGIAVVVGTAVAYTIYAVSSPWVFERLNDSRPLDADERERLGETADRDVPIRVVNASDVKESQGFAVGVVPGFRRVYLTDFLLDELTATEVRAVTEHEFAHFHRGHLLVRMVVSGLLVVGIAATIAEASAWSLFLAVVVGIPYWLALAAASRWTEYDADRQAATAESATAMAGALDALGEHNLLRREHNVLDALLETHPSIERRTARLGADENNSTSQTETTDSPV